MNLRILELESSQLFSKQRDKTQVLIANSILSDLFRTRMTHVYEVRTIAEIIGKKIGFDKIEELAIVAMSHDIGHPPLGHEGAELLDKKFKKLGLKEGFSDNNNNLRMIELSSLSFTDYELVSLIKYPSKLYSEQKKKYLGLLQRYVEEERIFWGQALKRTVVCNIMDFSDEIAYTTSDLYDGYATGFVSGDFICEKFLELASRFKSQPKLFSILNSIAISAKNDYKRALREDIFKLKQFFIEDSFWNLEKADMDFKSMESRKALKSIFEFNYKYFIKSKRVVRRRKKALKKLSAVVDFFLSADPSDFPSDMYREKYLNAKTRKEKLKVVRDMVSDMTDSYILGLQLN